MGKNKNGVATRREMRKAHRLAAKQKKQQRHALRAAQSVSASAGKERDDHGSGEGEGKQPSEGSLLLKRAKIVKVRGDTPTVNRKRGIKPQGRKRWRPEEIDPMIAAEDEELKRLERLLGVNGPSAEKKRAKLNRELEEEDGLGPDFGAFLAGLDRLAEAVEGRTSGSSDDGRGHEADWDFHRDVPEESSVSDAGERQGTSRSAKSKLQLVQTQRQEKAANDHDEDIDGESDDPEQDDDDDDDDEGDEENSGIRKAASSRNSLETIEEEPEGEQMEEEDVMAPKIARVANSLETIEEESEGDRVEDEESEEVSDGEDSEGARDDKRQQKEQRERESIGESARNVGAGEQRRMSEDDSSGESESDESKRAAGESDDHLQHAYRPTPGQDIYGRVIGSAEEGEAPAKYVPPHLRAAKAAEEASKVAADGKLVQAVSGKRAEVQRIVNGIMNRLSEETLEPVTAKLRETYRGYSTTEVSEAIWQATSAICVHEKQVMTTLIPFFSAVIAALNISLGADVGGFFLETIAKDFDAEMKKTGADSADGGDSSFRRRGTASNLLLLLAHMYNWGVAHCSLVYDIIGLLADAFNELEMELLLLLLRHSGYQLRSDDPQALKQIVALVKEKAASVNSAESNHGTPSTVPANVSADSSDPFAEDTNRWKSLFGKGDSKKHAGVAGGDGADDESEGTPACGPSDASATSSAGSGSRARFILDTILELQNHKRSRLQEQGQESGRRIRKWLGSVKSAKLSGGRGGGSGDASLRVSWSELVSTETGGRWWKVGAAWAGRASMTSKGSSAPGAAGSGSSESAELRVGDGASKRKGPDDDGEGGLMELAARQRMNTDVRRSVFVAIVGSSDCEDALEKILRLNLKGAQEREIARVIMECCCQEESYNPFYAHLAERVCDRQQKLRFTFQLAFWDALKILDEGAARRAGSLGRFMAHLVLKKQLSLTLLKAVEVPELSPSGLLLMRVFFHDIISAGDDASFMAVFRKLARPKGTKDAGGHSAARDNVMVFLRGHLGPAPGDWDRERKKAFRKRVKGACRLIEAMVTADELG